MVVSCNIITCFRETWPSLSSCSPEILVCDRLPREATVFVFVLERKISTTTLNVLLVFCVGRWTSLFSAACSFFMCLMCGSSWDFPGTKSKATLFARLPYTELQMSILLNLSERPGQSDPSKQALMCLWFHDWSGGFEWLLRKLASTVWVFWTCAKVSEAALCLYRLLYGCEFFSQMFKHFKYLFFYWRWC